MDGVVYSLKRVLEVDQEVDLKLDLEVDLEVGLVSTVHLLEKPLFLYK